MEDYLKMKKTLSLILAALMCAAMTPAVFADEAVVETVAEEAVVEEAVVEEVAAEEAVVEEVAAEEVVVEEAIAEEVVEEEVVVEEVVEEKVVLNLTNDPFLAPVRKVTKANGEKIIIAGNGLADKVFLAPALNK